MDIWLKDQGLIYQITEIIKGIMNVNPNYSIKEVENEIISRYKLIETNIVFNTYLPIVYVNNKQQQQQ